MKLKRKQELREIVNNSYNLTAAHFNATRSKMAAADFLWAAGKINKNDKVLDAGCGNGRLLDYIEVNKSHYLGLDNNSYLISEAQSRYPDYTFLKQDLHDLGYVDKEKFSRIFCSAVIIHIPSKEERHKLLTNFYKLSTVDAKLIISFWKMKGLSYNILKINNLFKSIAKFNIKDWRDLTFYWRNQDGQATSLRYYHYFSRRELRKELEKAGWKIEEELNDRYNVWFVAVK